MKATIQPQPILLELSADEAQQLLVATGNVSHVSGTELTLHKFGNVEKATAAQHILVKLYSALKSVGIK